LSKTGFSVNWEVHTLDNTIHRCKGVQIITKTLKHKNVTKNKLEALRQCIPAPRLVHTSVAIRIRIRIRIPDPDRRIRIPDADRRQNFISCSLAHSSLKIYCNPFGSFCAKLLTGKQTDKRTNNYENITSIAEV